MCVRTRVQSAFVHHGVQHRHHVERKVGWIHLQLIVGWQINEIITPFSLHATCQHTSGPVPLELASLEALEMFDLLKNKLTGELSNLATPEPTVVVGDTRLIRL